MIVGYYDTNGYFNANWIGNVEDRKNTSGAYFFIGDCLVTWLSKKHNSIFLSTSEAKYIVARRCCTQPILMKKMLKHYGIGTMNIHYDNYSGINISKNIVLHSHTKHIEIYHHFINDLVEEKVVSLEFVPTKHQLVNILTKPLDSLRFEFLRKSLSICLIDRSSKVIGFKGFELIVYVLFASFGLFFSLLWAYDF